MKAKDYLGQTIDYEETTTKTNYQLAQEIVDYRIKENMSIKQNREKEIFELLQIKPFKKEEKQK